MTTSTSPLPWKDGQAMSSRATGAFLPSESMGGVEIVTPRAFLDLLGP
jgi:hypothetical protein